MSKIAIIGAGAWGTALAIVLGRQDRHAVCLWAREEQVRESIASTRINTVFLPQCRIPDCVTVTGETAEALQDAEFVICSVPSQHCRVLFQQLAAHLEPEMMIVSATKGLE